MSGEPYQRFRKTGAETVGEREVPIEIGMMGFSLEDIAQGKQGFCVLPLGIRDATKWGGRKWVRMKVTAMEDVRANRDVIIANEQGDVKEHTPVELSYEKHIGGYQRVGENYPLPTSMGRKGITWTNSVLITTANATELIPSPGSAKKLRIHGVCLSNKHVTSVDVALSEETTGTELKLRHILAADGGNVDLNLTDMCWDLIENAALQYYPQAAYAGGVLVSIGYSSEDVG